MQFTSVLIIVILQATAILTAPDTEPAIPRPDPEFYYQLQRSDAASFHRLDPDEWWTVLSDERGLFLQVESESGRTVLRPAEFEPFKRTRRMTVTSRDTFEGDCHTPTFFAVGLESRSDDGAQLEYRLIMGEIAGGSSLEPPQLSLKISPVLESRSFGESADTIGVALPGINIMALTLVDLSLAAPKGHDVATTTYVMGPLDDDKVNDPERVRKYVANSKSSDSADQTLRDEKEVPWYADIPKELLNTSDEWLASGAYSLSKPSDRELAMAHLLVTHEFAFEAVGDGGDVSNQVKAFLVLLRDPDAASAFRMLLQHANLAGRLYALCGLRMVDRATFDREIMPFCTNTTEIPTFRGCSCDMWEVKDIAGGILDGSTGRKFRKAGQPDANPANIP